ncbi:MAG: hypothetical protein L0Y72_28180 [Gemmataceae bacterium]|nr:hypothetical protein [Gemmataceae bacterium]MCI0742926.1 hypothetical protein [Gemmataceae bacterium]
MPWSSRTETLGGGHILKVAIDQENAPLTYADVLLLWKGDAAFRSFHSGLLEEAPFTTYRWETPPVTRATQDQPFEFVLLDSPGLAPTPDRAAFATHFETAVDGICVFPNLGNDAILVVPSPLGPDEAYCHLAVFVREAPFSQRHALWQAVAEAMQERLGTKPVWLSTAGAGVSWLHVRLDSRPKYYGYAPYREQPK